VSTQSERPSRIAFLCQVLMPSGGAWIVKIGIYSFGNAMRRARAPRIPCLGSKVYRASVCKEFDILRGLKCSLSRSSCAASFAFASPISVVSQ
jgi:hypothetical protein